MEDDGNGNDYSSTPRQGGAGSNAFDVSAGTSLSDSRRAAAYGLSASRRKSIEVLFLFSTYSVIMC